MSTIVYRISVLLSAILANVPVGTNLGLFWLLLCQQQCQALSHRQRPDPAVAEGRPRSRDGTLLCPA